VDEQRVRAGDVKYLSLWRPVAPAGYVALGYMAGTGALPPPTAIIR
jgi:vacuolar protein sorting-associated protein 13A/C